MRCLAGRALGALLVGVVTCTACTAGAPAGSPPTAPITESPAGGASSPAGPPPAAATEGQPSAGASPTGSAPAEPSTPPGSSASPSPSTPAFQVARALRDIETLAVRIGPRHATSRAFRAAADLVERRFVSLGYDVRRESVAVPGGNSWGTPVRAGTSRNVIADPPGFDETSPHVVVVAHLDTVPVAPGAEDNASGVSVLLELARLAAAAPPAVPVRFIAFGAEEPRGTGDRLHHFGSQQHVAGLSATERRAILGVVALDRVGVRASAVPVCSALPSGNELRTDVRAAGRAAAVPTRACTGNTTSDHWSYAKADIPAIRLGGVPYPAYHSARDTPDVIDRRQLGRVGRLMWAWLRAVD